MAGETADATSVTFVSAPTGPTGPKDAEMAAKFDNQGKPPVETPPPAATPPAGETPPATETPPTETPPQEPEVPAGIDMDALSAEWTKDGKLSDASYQDLAKRGIPREMVDNYIASQVAEGERQVESILAPYGGKEGWQEMSNWVHTLAPADVARYEAALKADPKTALEAISAAYQRVNGAAPGTVLGGRGNGGTVGVTGFESRAQMVSAMKDPKYKSDPAYRAQVEKRVALTTF